MTYTIKKTIKLCTQLTKKAYTKKIVRLGTSFFFEIGRKFIYYLQISKIYVGRALPLFIALTYLRIGYFNKNNKSTDVCMVLHKLTNI